MRLRTTATTVTALTLMALALTSCSASNADATSSPTPKATKTAEASGVADPSGACTKGVASPTASNQEHLDLEGCALVDVLGSNNTISLGKTEQLTVEGSKNTITVDGVKSVTNIGKDNTVYYTGDEPSFDERGTGTKVIPADAAKQRKG